ncbi:acyl-CoA dehydrogenase family protein [Actinomadura sp. BRA 177]|uniref:acyl-CoA dehydrogenase family protein n=1 Tax=Actinomadura sp. BRA 177 TaxID=2745202 RepID=UPI0015954C5F|nr:acyl-CoA dehydrogenase family protein [Actinomadura sp. BRA 177]NVI89066.1 acyl-CoA dehydrogenase family protein [Actinomadura sp. BRA 177]
MLEFEFTEEQRALRDLAGSVAERTWTDDAVRAQLKTSAGFDREVWRTLGRDLGVLGLALPTESGEAVGGVVDLAIVAEEFGRVLAGVPLLGCVALAGTVLARSGDAAGLVPKIVSGETVVSLVATDARGAWAPERTGIIADGPVLCGEASHVLDAVAADAFVAVAQAEGRPSLFLVDAGAQGLAVEPLTTLDQTRRLGRVRFDGTPAQLLGEPGTSALDAVSAARDVGAVVLAAEAAGASARLLAMSVEYATARLQFGRPIGSFQGVKHRCADMHVAVEQSRSTAYHAAWTLDDPSLDDPRIAVDLATVETAADYQAVAKNTVQVHGGIGFTWEHPVHLYYKRAVSDASLLGGRAAASERLAAMVLDAALIQGAP